MANIIVSEKFLSLQGEGRYVGVPSLFLRTFGCNFRCVNFGVENKELKHNEEVAYIIQNIDQYKKFNELPLTKTGCDSYNSVYPEFKRFVFKYETNELVEELLKLLPNKTWVSESKNPIHLVITGGEPLLGWQKAYSEMLQHKDMQSLSHLTFETNGTQEIKDQLAVTLSHWLFKETKYFREITFSVSPKLSESGEDWDKAIKPDVVASYEQFGNVYLKFVVSATSKCLEEVKRAVKCYRDAGFMGNVYLMPVGGTQEEYIKNMTPVAEMALANGYYFSPRLHISLYGNKWGT